MTDTDFRDRILADLSRVEGKLDAQGETMTVIRERLRAVEVRAGLIAAGVSAAAILIGKLVSR
jgi:hypothetical protein